nr:MAG TPA: hypothetical protein [Caudoviricetes sp.]
MSLIEISHLSPKYIDNVRFIVYIIVNFQRIIVSIPRA